MWATGFPWALPHVSKRQLSVDKCTIGSWKELTLQTWHSDGVLYEHRKGGSAKARARLNIKSINPAYWPYLSSNSITLEYLMQNCHKYSLFYMNINVFFKYAIHLISAIPPFFRCKIQNNDYISHCLIHSTVALIFMHEWSFTYHYPSCHPLRFFFLNRVIHLKLSF